MKTNFFSKSIAMILTIALVAALIVPVASAAPGGPIAVQDPASPFAQNLESKYIDPDRVFSTDVRWWLGSAGHTDESLLESIQALYDGGFRGAELCMQTDSAAPNAIYAYGSAEWAHKWKLMINKMLDLGMTVSLTSGTNWSTSNVPGLDPNSQAAMHVAAMSGTPATVDAGATFTGALPAPSTRRSVTNNPEDVAQFIGAYAYKQTANNIADYDSCVDLSALVTQPGADPYTQNITWTAPADGTYRLYGLWSHGNYHSSSPAQQTSYATNYFDLRGVDALRTFWEANYLDEPELNQKILDGDVQLFMDSIEISVGGGFTWWCEDMPEEFEARKGYDIRPYLFLMNGFSGASFWSNTYTSMPGTTRLAGDNETLRERIITDYHDVITTLYIERMLTPLKEWLNSVGIKTRAQVSYGKPLEMSEPIMELDYPECENRVMMNQADYFRNWTGGAKLENKVLSTESSAQSNSGNRFSRQLHLRDAYSHYAAGIQRVIWHIWNAEYGYGAANAWPGHQGGGSGFFKFGTREPNSKDYDEFNSHLGRVQQLMQTGKSRTDVGFISNKWYLYLTDSGEGTANPTTPANINRMNWQFAHQGIFYRSTELQDNGYTYDYFSPKFLYDDDVYFDEQTKTIEKAGYKALVLYQDWLDIKAAERILEWAKKGLPVVILGGAAARTPFNDGKDAQLAEIMGELKLQPTVRTATVADYEDYFSATAVGYEDNVMEMLQDLGVYPYAEYIEPNHQLLAQNRIDDEGNMYLYVYNYCPNTYHQYSHIDSVKTEDHGTNIKTEIMMDGMFIPYKIDAWSGEVTQLAEYRYENGRTIFPIDLDFDNIALFAFESVDSETLHIVSTDAESAYAVADSLVVRATESGTYTTALSNGFTYQNTVAAPAPYDITDWDVTVESWTSGTQILTRTEPQILDPSVMTVNSTTATAKTNIDVQLPTLTTWNNIPEVGRNVSGLAYYRATFNWDASKADGAYLNFGDKLVDSMKVWINGQKVGGDVTSNPTKAKRSVGIAIDGVIPAGKDLYSGGVNLTKPVADIGPYLVDGKNEIYIEYSSSLTNVQITRGVITGALPALIYNWHNHIVDYRAYGPAQAVIVPYVEQVIKVFADIRADAAAVGVNTPASYTVSLDNAKGAGVVTLSFTADSRYLDLTNATALNGFTILDPLSWEYVGSQLWKGTVKLYCPGFVQNNDPLDILRISGVALNLLGDTTVTLTDIAVSGDVYGYAGEIPSVIKTAEAATSIVSKTVFSKYDLNHDGKIDELDLAIVVYYYLANDLEADWEVVKFDIASAKDCDVALNGRVDLADMIEVIANYCDSY
ncbi:MAG: hypothetical protein FWH55_10415 [Oscillospiraceae bacterium]|nr:hypothetical protein [Oscillospiraceae bacterium]